MLTSKLIVPNIKVHHSQMLLNYFTIFWVNGLYVRGTKCISFTACPPQAAQLTLAGERLSASWFPRLCDCGIESLLCCWWTGGSHSPTDRGVVTGRGAIFVCVRECVPVCRDTDRVALEIDAGVVELICGRVDGCANGWQCVSWARPLAAHLNVLIVVISMISLQWKKESGVKDAAVVLICKLTQTHKRTSVLWPAFVLCRVDSRAGQHTEKKNIWIDGNKIFLAVCIDSLQ